MTGIAIIGYGYWGPNLARNFAETEGASLAMVCDADPKRLALAQKRFPAVAVGADFDEALRNPAIDAVAIATPVHTHYELAKRAINAGKHVLVEKPLTARVDHAEELVALAEKKGVVLMVDHVFVYSPPVLKMKELVAQGRLGKLFFIDSVRINLGLFQHDVNVVWDLAPHDLSIVDFLVERLPISLSAVGAMHANSDIEDVAYLTLDYGEGLIANFHVNWLSPVKVRQMIIGGSERGLIYNDLDVDEKIKVYDRGIDVGSDPNERSKALISYRSGDIWSPNLATREPLSRMAQDFITCIESGGRPVSDGQSGLRIVKILDAAQRSIKSQNVRINI
ncbi:MAG TPA: Gfo/Idh/MocA family oxidoreductase [Blastocatellia bacterium]|nr:Gfo/Idh/MocA family oxidoreductase [Blastocatellia bacterium]